MFSPNPIVVVAVLIQSAIAKKSRQNGAFAGYAVTTGLLLWGLNVYGAGGSMALFGIEVSQPLFIGFCLFWYAFDTKELLLAKRQRTNQPQSTVNSVSASTIPANQANAGNLVSELDKCCVVCGQAFGPHLSTHCTPNSMVAFKEEGTFRKKFTYYSLSGMPLNDADIDRLQARESVIYKQAHSALQYGAQS